MNKHNKISSNSNSIKKNYGFNLMYKIVTMLTPLITAPYISRVFGPSVVGDYSYIYSVAQYFYVFALLGISDYGSRSIAQVRHEPDKLNLVFNELLTMQVINAVLSIIFYGIYCLLFAKFKFIAVLQGIQIVSVLFDVTWLFFGLEDFVAVSVRNIIVKISSVALIMIFVKRPSDLWIYTLIISGSTIVAQLVILPFLRKYVKFVKVTVKGVLRHYKPNVILFLPVIAANLLHYFDKVMLGGMSTSSELGYYDNAEKLIQVPNSMVTALGAVILPAMTRNIRERDERSIKRIEEYSFLFIVASTCAFGFGISAVAKEFVPLFFGEEFIPTTPMIYYLAPAMFFISCANIMKNEHLLPYGKDSIFALCLILGVVVNVILNSIFIRRNGGVGASLATSISEGTIMLAEVIYLRKKLNIRSMLFVLGSFACIGSIMFACIFKMYVINDVITVFVKFIVGAILYLLLSTFWVYAFKKDIIKHYSNK